MSLLDIRTILIGAVVSDAICALVIGMVWLQHRRSSPGLGRWMAGFTLQRWRALLGCAFLTRGYTNYMCYKIGAFKSEHTLLPLVSA